MVKLAPGMHTRLLFCEPCVMVSERCLQSECHVLPIHANMLSSLVIISAMLLSGLCARTRLSGSSSKSKSACMRARTCHQGTYHARTLQHQESSSSDSRNVDR